MADKAFMSFTQNGEQVGLGHSLLVGGDTMEYRALVSDVAKKIIEDYAGSTLAGSAQSVQAALASLNSNTITKPTVQTEHDDLNNLITPGFYFTQNETIVQNAPQSGAYNSAIVVMRARTTDIIQFFISTNARNIWWRISQSSGLNWSSWFKINQT
jgi:hypothetical protein